MYKKSPFITLFSTIILPIIFSSLTCCKQIMNNKKTINANVGSFEAKDDTGAPIILEWEKIEGQSPRLNEVIKSVSTILAQVYTRQELEFAHAHPETVPHEYFLKSVAPLFSDGIEKVNWQQAEQQLSHTFTQLFTTTDFAHYTKLHDTSLFVIAKDKKTNTPLGIIQFLITPDFEYGTVKSAYFGIASAALGRGLEKVLMGSIFQLIPDTQRIFMHTRTTNTELITLYKSWGFTQFPGTLEHWIDLEYWANKSDILQKK